MNMKAVAAVVLAGATLAATLVGPEAAEAHHSFAIFDHTRQITLSGTVKVFEWTNPHSRIELTVASRAGGEDTWTITALSPNLLERHGWKKTSLKTGDKVTVLIYPLRDGRAGGNLISVTLPDGRGMGGGAG